MIGTLLVSDLANRVKNKKKTSLSAYRLHDTTHLICVVTSLKPTVLALEWAVAVLPVFGRSADVAFEMFACGTNLTR